MGSRGKFKLLMQMLYGGLQLVKDLGTCFPQIFRPKRIIFYRRFGHKLCLEH